MYWINELEVQTAIYVLYKIPEIFTSTVVSTTIKLTTVQIKISQNGLRSWFSQTFRFNQPRKCDAEWHFNGIKSFRLRREATSARISNIAPHNSQRPALEQSFCHFQGCWSSKPRQKCKKVCRYVRIIGKEPGISSSHEKGSFLRIVFRKRTWMSKCNEDCTSC